MEDRSSDGIPAAIKSSPSTTSLVKENCGVTKLVFSSMVAGGVQFGWALQLSLLTPYIQVLGIEHAFASFVWLCGPISGLLVQPCVGVWSDRCTSKFGRRRPFILLGCICIAIAITLVGFSADIGARIGDTKESCTTYEGKRWRAAIVFIIGFWMLDLANNAVQGPARALLADISGPDQCNLANSIFCLWMAVGNILGYSSGASGQWSRWFPFLLTNACCKDCVNLKAAFLAAVMFMFFCMIITLIAAKEVPLEKLDAKDEVTNKPSFVLVNILTSVRQLAPGMPAVLFVMAVTWLSWFPYFLYITDWMGREIFQGDPKGQGPLHEAYQEGVRQGAFSLLLNAIVLAVCSFFVNPLCKKIGANMAWAISNFTFCLCMIGVTVLGLYSARVNTIEAHETIKKLALAVIALIGFPLSFLFSVPFAMTADLNADSGAGQGLATGVLNIAIVVPQIIISVSAGPWDALFGGGNTPAYALAAGLSFIAGVFAVLKLPKIKNISAGMMGGGH